MQSQPLEIRAGGGLVLTLFGLPFLLAGLGVIYAGFQGSIQMEGGGQASPLFYIPFGGVFATVGGALVFGRAGQKLDPRRRQLIEWWGLLFLPLRKTVRDWDEFEEVVLRKEIVRNKNSSRTVYRTYLEGTGEAARMDSCSTFLESRRQGEKVAKCIKLPLHDLASGSDTIRQPDELDVSLRDQMLKEGRKLELTAPPTDAKSTHTMDAQQAVFQLPPSGFQALHLIRIVSSAFVFFVVLVFFAIPMIGDFSDAPMFIKAFMLGMLSLFAVPLLIGILSATKDALSSRRITLNQEVLQLDSRSPLGGSVQKMPLEQLEELELITARGNQWIEARSDHDVIKFGAGLSAQEMSWLKNIIEYILIKM